MSELDRLQDAFMKADALAQKGDKQAAADARLFADEIRRLQSSGAPPRQEKSGFMGQVNAGIADAVGGTIDFLNPFDDPVWQNTPVGMSSARDAMVSGMRGIGADVASGRPEGMVDAVGRGVGAAAGAIVPVGLAANALRAAPGVVGAVAGDVTNALSRVPGVAAEVLAGGIAGGASQAVESAGGPEWLQQTAAILSPMAIPAAVGAARLAGRAAASTPVVGSAIRTGREILRNVAPMTASGAREVVKDRLRGLAGGEDRAAELGRMIDPNDPLGRSPAQQTGDPNMLGLEASAAAESPLARERLASRRATTMDEARRLVQGAPGRVGDARDFFKARLSEFRADMQRKIATAAQMARESVEGVGPRASETSNSTQTVEKIKAELDANLEREAALWRAVPVDARVSTSRSVNVAKGLFEELPRAQRNDFPGVAATLLLSDNGLGEATTVSELHGLYSELRRISRAAMSGTNQNKNAARIANDIAEAILSDLGAISADTPAGQAINEARAFSRALHEIFDQGAVGRILKRTISGDETMAPEAALKSTVGVGGPQAVADNASIRRAAPAAADNVADFFRGKFLDSIITPDGKFSPQTAGRWLRDNREVLSAYPELQAEFFRAMRSQGAAETYAARSEARLKAAENASAVSRFNQGQDGQAVLSVIGSDDPAQTARALVATARKDETGKALAGLKTAFSDYLIAKAGTDEGLSGKALERLLKDRATEAALRQVFSAEEVQRLKYVATALVRMDGKSADVGPVMDTAGNKMIEYVVRIVAARQGGQMGGGSLGGSMQTANILQERARTILRNLTNDRARQLLMDAVENPELFKTLLMEDRAFVVAPERVLGRIAPYLTGGAAEAARDRTD